MPVLAAAATAVFSAVTTVATAVGGAVLGSMGLSGIAGMGIASFTGSLTIGTVVGFAAIGSTALNMISMSRKLKAGAGSPSPLAFKADPNAYLTYVAGGPVAVGGHQVFAQTAGKKNAYLTYTTVLSAGGPVQSVQPFTANDNVVNFGGSQGAAALGIFDRRMWQKFSLGAVVGATALTMANVTGKDAPGTDGGHPYEWTSAHTLPSLAHTLWTLKSDPDRYPQLPKPLWQVIGGPVYDPRKDSTFPGGNGPQRPHDRATWSTVGNTNPYLQALTFIIGHTFNGFRLGGVGAPLGGIDVPAFVYGANVADANGWKIAWAWNTGMRKWDVLATMLQAGGGQPLVRASKISCLVEAPRVSIGTITDADIKGPFSITGTSDQRERKNTIIPRCKSAAHKFTVQPYGPVTAQVYLDEDLGVERPVELEYEAIADNGDGGRQVRQIAAYDLANMREGLTGALPLPMRFMKYRAGDCLTVDAPSTLLNGQKIVITKREVYPKARRVTLTFRSETDGKHDYALGRTASPPPAPVMTGLDPSIIQPPTPGAWVITPGNGGGAGGDPGGGGGGVPSIVITPANPDPVDGGGWADDAAATHVVVRFRREGLQPGTADPWPWVQEEFPATAQVIELKGLSPLTTYEVELAYRVRGVVGLWTPYGLITTASLVANNALAVGNREAGDILDQLDAVPGMIDQATAGLNLALSQIDAQINDPATGLVVRVGAAETATTDLAQRVSVTETQINAPGTGLTARVADLTTATANLATGKADVARLQLLEARSGGDAAMNQNPAFAQSWESGVALPPPYQMWSGNAPLTERVAGIDGPHALRWSVPVGSAQGMAQNQSYIPGLKGGPGWYVMEATVRLESGTLSGSGVLMQAINGPDIVAQLALNFSTDPDVTGTAPGAGVPGRVYRFAKLVRFVSPCDGFLFYVMAGWDGMGAITAKTITFDRAICRPASAAEIDVGVARNGGANLSARFGLLETATTDLVNQKADVGRVALLEARAVPNEFGNGDLSAGIQGFVRSWGGADDGPMDLATWDQNSFMYVKKSGGGNAQGQLGGVAFNGGPVPQGTLPGNHALFRPWKVVQGERLGFAFDARDEASFHGLEPARWAVTIRHFDNAGTVVQQITGHCESTPGEVNWHRVGHTWDAPADGFVTLEAYIVSSAGPTGRAAICGRRFTFARLPAGQTALPVFSSPTDAAAAARVTTVEGATAELVGRPNGGGNLIGNATLASTTGWTFYPAGGVFDQVDMAGNGTGLNMPGGNDWHPEGENCLTVHTHLPESRWYDWQCTDVQVEGGKTFEFGARFATHRCAAEVYLAVWDGTNWAYHRARTLPGNQEYGSGFNGGRNLRDYGLFWGKITLPNTARRAQLILRKGTTNAGETDSWCWFTRPFIREIAATQTGPSAWDAGAGQWNYKASWAVGASVPGADAFISAAAQKADGRAASTVAIGAHQIALYNQVGQNWLKAMEVVGGNALFSGGLQAGAFIRLGNGNGWPVALKPVDFQASDGEVVSFGTDLGGLPSLTFAMNNLAALAAGETYDVRATNLTATGFTLYAKINVPGTPSTQTHNADKATVTISAQPGYQIWLAGKPESPSGVYTIKANGIQRHRIFGRQGQAVEADSESRANTQLSIWAFKSGAWVKLADRWAESMVDVYQYPSGQHNVDAYWNLSENIQGGSGVTHLAVTYAGSDNGFTGAVWGIGPISWQSAGSSSSVRSATPNGQKTLITVRP